MEFIDALVAMIIFGCILVWKVFEAAWFVILPVVALGTVLYLWAARCPECKSFSSREPRGEGKSMSIDPDTGDMYSERYDRVCNACKHKWISGISTSFDDPRPVRKKILDGKALRAVKEHARRGGRFLD
jgi:hypothetical protein